MFSILYCAFGRIYCYSIVRYDFYEYSFESDARQAPTYAIY